MERPTSDKILFINSDILIHLMPSKCGILNPGISHNISLVPPQHRGLCRAHTSSPYLSRDLIQILSQLTYLDDLRGGCEVCVAAYLCGFVAPGPVCVVAAVWSCTSVCGRRADNRLWSTIRRPSLIRSQPQRRLTAV